MLSRWFEIVAEGVLLLFILVIWPIVAHCYPDTLWTKYYGGIHSDYGFCVQVTSDSGFIVAGRTTSFGEGSDDVWLLKTNAEGDTQWTRTYGTPASEWAYYVEQTADGGYIVAADRWSYLWLLKTNSVGDTLWTRLYGWTLANRAFEVHQTPDGGYLFCGQLRPADSLQLYYYYWMLTKTDANGDTVWVRIYEETGRDWSVAANSMCSTPDGGYVLVGSGPYHAIRTDSLGNMLGGRAYTPDPEDARFNSIAPTSDGGYILTGWVEANPWFQIFLVKTDSLGEMQWSRKYGGVSDLSDGKSVEQTTDGGYIVAGFTGNYWQPPDAYIVRTDANGDSLWTRRYGGGSDDYARSVRQIDGDSLHAQDFIIAGYGGVGNGGDLWLLRIGEITSIEGDGDTPLPESFGDLKIYPNPTNAIAKINYNIVQPGEVILSIYNILGQRMYEQTVVHKEPGRYSTSWDGSRYPSGIYLVRVKMGEMEETKRLLILK